MKKYGIIGALCIVLATIVGFFFDFPAENIVSIAVAAFGLTMLVLAAVEDGKKHNVKTWVTFISILLAIAGGMLACIGNLSESTISQIVGATVALLAVIFSIATSSKSK